MECCSYQSSSNTLYKDKAMPLRIACGQAYDNTLASAHSWMVKNAIRTSMYMLPTREQFLNSIKETGGHQSHVAQWHISC